ncbi:MAG: DUF2029 domain-containing protein [Acidimicrobiia bacterium]|nr:DUF2029 domain-containing protein [Acidimicrobiia bacterium]
MLSAAERSTSRRSELLLALGVLLISSFVTHDWTAQPASRYALTVAIVDDHSLQLDPYEDFLGIDQAQFDGHIYSDKAPYQPALAAPFYYLYRLAGGDPYPARFSSGDFGAATNYGLWWVTLWSAAIPAAALAVVIRRMVARTHSEVATRVTVAIMLATTILPFASQLFAHVLAALCVATAWHLLRRRDYPSTAAVFAAGVIAGVGIGTEYLVAAIAAIMLIHVATLRSWSRVVALSAGTVIATLPLLAYNWLVFGDPFELAYQGHLKNFQGEGALGVYNLETPGWGEFSRTLAGPKGLFILTPVVLMAVAGAILAITNRSRTRRDAWVAITSLGIMLAASTGIDGYGGGSPGPRYMIPALPLLAVPLASAWRRIPILCGATTVMGAAVMLLATITNPVTEQGLRYWLDFLWSGHLARNVLTGRDQPWVLLVTTAAGVALIVTLVVQERGTSPPAGSN